MPYQFDEIRGLFDENEWDVGVLSGSDVLACANAALKQPAQPYGLFFFQGMAGSGTAGAAKRAQYALWKRIKSALVLVRRSLISLDYSLYIEADEILQRRFPHPRGGDLTARRFATDRLSIRHLHYLHKEAPWVPVYFDFKSAAILTGLGVRANNSLVHSYRFGFDCKICAFGFKEEIVGYEKEINLGTLDLCEGCTDCMDNCPAGAIHCDGNVRWLDAPACDRMFFSGCPSRGVPGVVDTYHKCIEPELTRREVTMKAQANGLKWNKQGFSWDRTLGLMKDGELVPIPICRVCQEQPRCGRKL